MLTRKSIDTVLLSVGAEKLSQREWDWMKMLEPRQSDGCKLKTGPVSPVVAAHPAEYVCSEDLFY